MTKRSEQGFTLFEALLAVVVAAVACAVAATAMGTASRLAEVHMASLQSDALNIQSCIDRLHAVNEVSGPDGLAHLADENQTLVCPNGVSVRLTPVAIADGDTNLLKLEQSTAGSVLLRATLKSGSTEVTLVFAQP